MGKQPSRTRSTVLGNVGRAVIQVGSSLLAERPVARLRALAMDLAELRQGGMELVLVTAGAVPLGRQRLGVKRQPRPLPLLQAAAAVGEVALLQAYEDALAPFGIPVGLTMVAPGDLDHRGRFLRLRHTLMALLDYGVVPLVSFNQALADQGLGPDQNDLLAARVPRLVEADLLVMLAAAEGIYGASPRRGGEVVHLVEEIEALAEKADARLGQGRIQRILAAKLQAARDAASAGVPTVVASGLRSGVLQGLLHNDTEGTLILPSQSSRSRKQWIAHDLEPAGSLRVSEEAHKALLEAGRSLAVSEVRLVEGAFNPGDAVRVLDGGGHEFARGLVSYSARELDAVKGKELADVERLLGAPRDDEVIRRDDLVVL